MAESNPYTASQADAEATPNPSAYCQECGRALTSGTLRRLGGGIFCIPCAAQRSAHSGWQPVASTNFSSGAPPIPSSTAAADRGPNPSRACVLGFIPGVGAMYNGQYAKAALHLIVFVGLLTLADHLNDAFYWLVWGWVFYQVFDAYHTARARRDGLPLPNPFGWNDVGERWGFPSHASGGNADRSAIPGAPKPRTPESTSRAQAYSGVGDAYSMDVPFPREGARPVHGRETPTGPYASMADDRRPMPFQVPPVHVQAPREGAWQTAPANAFVPTYVGEDARADELASTERRFPLGAIWLVSLGLLFLLGNLLPHFALTGRWLVPLALLGVSLWSGRRRIAQHRRSALLSGQTPNLACALLGPVVLFTLSLLMCLQAAELMSLARTWPVLLVVWGVMLLAQRALAQAQPVYDPAVSDYAQAPASIPPARTASGTGSLGL